MWIATGKSASWAMLHEHRIKAICFMEPIWREMFGFGSELFEKFRTEGVGEELVRLSVGLEDPDDLVDDLRQGLRASQKG